MIDPALTDSIRRQSQRLTPVETNTTAQLASLSGIQCVLFDIYGTLLISASGDIGTSRQQARESALQASLRSVEWPAEAATRLLQRLFETIEQAHAESRGAGIEYPEVDIVEIWRRALSDQQGIAASDRQRIERLAVEFELRVNPTWPMPHCRALLDRLRKCSLRMGIISNAQFFTPLILETLLDAELSRLGFQPPLCYYSYRHGHAKPGTYLYQQAARQLAGEGIEPRGVLYVGNDLLNDIWPASQVGFRTALFAGDARSLRWRTDEPRTLGLQPDLVLTDLRQVADCLTLAAG